MKCPNCQTENREGANFCTRCGTPLALVCGVCHTPAEEGDVYCANCGAHLQLGAVPAGKGEPRPMAVRKPAAPAAAEGEGGMNAERKNVTVLFGDLSGFTAMSEKLDPEEVTTIMNACLSMMGDVVVSYEGYIDKFIGDCIMALFGAPVSHENDPELAIRAALEMSKKVADFNKTLPIKLEKPLALHIGINTGLVVAGKMGSDSRMDYTVMGDTVNLASRLESKAERGQVFISAYTYRQVKNLFEFIEHDPVEVKGKRDPVAVYEVVRALEDSEIRGAAFAEVPLVGRESEVETLAACAERLHDGEGQAVFLVSDPGFGKSRVQVELKRRFDPGTVQLIEGRCHSYGRNTPYQTFIDLFKHLCAIDSDDLSETVAQKLEDGLPLLLGEEKAMLSDPARKALALVGRLLDVDLAKRYDVPLEEMSPQELHTATIRSLAWTFAAMGRRHPVVLSLEDLHYADTASVEVVAGLIQEAVSAPLMLLLLLRPEKGSPSAKLLPLARRLLGDRAIEVTFERLTRSDCEALVKHLLEATELPKELLELVGSRSDGNPLFLQEIVRSLLDVGAIEKSEGKVKIVKKLDEVTIPSSITGLIMARYDQLEPDLRELLAKAAVVGPTFSRQLIALLVGESGLDAKLDTLMAGEMIFESQSFPDVEYAFHTTYIQEAVYDTLLLKRRQALHKEVAEAIRTLFGERLQDQVEALAHHYLEARELAEAYTFLVRSGMKAKNAFANESAARFLRRAIDVGADLENPEPPLAELEKALSQVLELLGEMDGAIEAWKAVIATVEEPTEKADAMRNIGRIEEKRGAKEVAIQVYEEALALIKDQPESEEYGMLLMNLSWVLNRFRRIEEAVEKAKEALALFEKHETKEHVALCCNNLAVFYENLEEYDTALEYNMRSLDLFTKLGHRRQIGNVQLSLGYLYSKRGEMEKALEFFGKSAEAMDRIGNRVGSATALLAKGRNYADLECFEEAEIALLTALHSFRELEMDRRVVATQVSLVGVLLDKKDLKSAGEQLESAWKTAEANDFTSDMGKIARLRGRYYRLDGKEKESEEHYGKAVEIFNGLGRERDVKSVEREWKG